MKSGFQSTENARLTKLLAIGFLLLLLNSSYLAAFGEPTLAYLANIGLHFVGGGVLLLLFLRLLARTWQGLSAPFRLSALVLLLSGGLGRFPTCPACACVSGRAGWEPALPLLS
jgi:hypothetical protein